MTAGVPMVPGFSCEQASTEACSRQVLGWYVASIAVPPLAFAVLRCLRTPTKPANGRGVNFIPEIVQDFF
jgi:hypothetical protein